MIGPAPGLALEIDVLAAEEERLHDEVLQLELALLDAVRDALMRRIEPARVTRHRDLLRGLLRLVDLARVRWRIRDWNLDLDVLACLHALDGSRSGHVRRRTPDPRAEAAARQRFPQARRPVRNAALVRDALRRLLAAAADAHDFDVLDLLQAIEMFADKSAVPTQHGLRFH